ncbi:MAG: M48 family metallopeptidase [Pseudomonadota bacterium]
MALARAIFYDGEVAEGHDAALFPDGDMLRIERTDGQVVKWPLSDIREERDHGWEKGLVLCRLTSPDRLVIRARADGHAVRAALPHLRKRDIDRSAMRRVALWGMGALMALAALLLVILPGLANQLAPLIPPAREAAFGEALVRQMARMLNDTDETDTPPFCATNEGRAALNAMAARLLEGRNLPYTLKIEVLDHDMINAFAAPGGWVVIVRGLLDKARSPDEVAGVLAHEIGHVAARDPTRLALRGVGSAGLLGLVFGDFAGAGVMVLLADRLLTASYTRDAERAADDYALSMLADAGISSDGLADFFARLTERYGDDREGALRYFASHPAPSDRLARVRAGSDVRSETPILTPGQWQALKSICRT